MKKFRRDDLPGYDIAGIYDGPCVDGPFNGDFRYMRDKVIPVLQPGDGPGLNIRIGFYRWNGFGAFWAWEGWQ
jgi:hypothetical protein